MILKIKVPTHIGIYKLSEPATIRTIINLVRLRYKFLKSAGIEVERVILIYGKEALLARKFQPALF